jgi:hypothetical protein
MCRNEKNNLLFGFYFLTMLQIFLILTLSFIEGRNTIIYRFFEFTDFLKIRFKGFIFYYILFYNNY